MRIAALSLVPLLAFGVVAATTWSGQQALDAAFTIYGREAGTARLALLLRTHVVTMQYEARRLGQTRAADAPPAYRLVEARLAKDFAALRTLTADDEAASAQFVSASRVMRRASEAFAKLVTVVEDLGHGNSQGRTKDLEAAAAKVKAIVDGAPESDHRDAVESVFKEVRQSELELRVDGTEARLSNTLAKIEAMSTGANLMLLPGETRTALLEAMAGYTKTLRIWAEDMAEIRGQSTTIEGLFTTLLSTLDGFRSTSELTQAHATEALKESKASMLMTVFAAIGLAATLGAILSVLVGRSITRPLARLSETMQRLASGETEVEVPQAALKDEIGAMARNVLVFRDGAVERERLAAAQASETGARQRRAGTVDGLVTTFGSMVDTILGELRNAANGLGRTAGSLDNVAAQVSHEARAAGAAAESAATNVTAAAAPRRSSQDRSARSPTRPPSRPPSPSMPPERRREPSTPWQRSPGRRPALARWSGLSRRSRGRRTCWRSMPRSKRRGRARRARGLPSSPPR
jgi:methyl-accepting chemotaxis protein